jgi:hypothetical protein
MYYSGLAINKDIERAYLWFNLAAAQGVESAATVRDIVVKLLTPNQIAALQQEAGLISRGYRSSTVADKSKTGIIESDPEDVNSVAVDEPMPVATEPTAKSVFRILKDWWKNNLQ